MNKKTNGILNIDGFNWSFLKLSDSDRHRLTQKEYETRVKLEQNTFSLYHQEIKDCIQRHLGEVWNTIGDCTIASGFPDIDESVSAAISIQRRLSDFNRNRNRLPNPLIVRIGVTCGSLPAIDPKKRGEYATSQLDEAGHLQKDCPPGRIRISRTAFEAMRFNKRDFRPGLSVDLKHKSAYSLVWSQRSLTLQDEKYTKNLTPHQQRCFPIIAVSEDYLSSHPCDLDFSAISSILSDSFVIMGETRTNIPKDTPVSHTAATSDAVGAIEIFAAFQSSPGLLVGIDEWVDCEDLASQKNIIIMGSTVVNVYAYAVNLVFPFGFKQEPDGFLRIRVPDNKETRYFPHTVEHSGFDKHYGLVVLTRNPINPKYYMLWIAGISGMATQAAARFVRDLVLNPTQTLNTATNSTISKPNIAVVQPHWEHGWSANDYQTAWKVREYKIAWLDSQTPGNNREVVRFPTSTLRKNGR